MDLLGRLGLRRPEPPSAPPDAEVDRLLDAYLAEPRPVAADLGWEWQLRASAFETGRALLAIEPTLQLRVLLGVVGRLTHLTGRHLTDMDDYTRLYRLRALGIGLLRRHLPYTRRDAWVMLSLLASGPGTWFDLYVPLQGYLRSVERWLVEHPAELDGELRAELERLRGRIGSTPGAATRKSVAMIDQMLGEGAHEADETPEIDAGDDWGHAAAEALEAMPQGEERRRWLALLAYAQGASGARPSAKWARRARELVDALGAERFKTLAVECLGFLRGPTRGSTYVGAQGWGTPSALVAQPNGSLLTGLVWACASVDDADLARAVGDAGLQCYRKLPGIGARCTRAGNACVYALGAMPGQHGLLQLQRLRRDVKYQQAQTLIETALQAAAERAGYSRDDLEEVMVPTQVAPNELAMMLAVQRSRLERLFLVPDRSWSLADWRERFADQPVVGELARRLVWRFEDADGRAATGAWLDGGIVDAEDRPVVWLAEDRARVRLWHPVGATPDEVLAWREWLERHEVTQPFKQAHREVYLLTDAERTTETYSNRFAAHVLRQHQLKALCDQRGWRMRLQGGGFDPGDCMPRQELPRWGLWAEFWVNGGNGEESQSGISRYVGTDQVRFGRLDGGSRWNAWDPVPLADVPPRVFSEVMRDVDLFVGVCSVGNDPTWADGGPPEHREYWTRYAFGDLGESAKSRRAVLERLLPRLTRLDGRWSLSDRALVVRGDLRTYRIHLGSGNILMAPNDQYLCIVPGRGKGAAPATDGLLLPFEGDGMLSIILSKALLLADDRAIRDPSITRQIGR